MSKSELHIYQITSYLFYQPNYIFGQREERCRFGFGIAIIVCLENRNSALVSPYLLHRSITSDWTRL